MTRAHFTASVAAFAASFATLLVCAARASAQPAPSTPAPAAPRTDDTPWPVVLGQRTAALERDWPVVDQVVLVPDGRTYLDELAK